MRWYWYSSTWSMTTNPVQEPHCGPASRRGSLLNRYWLVQPLGDPDTDLISRGTWWSFQKSDGPIGGCCVRGASASG